MQETEIEVECPYCGESFTILADPSQSQQSYVEDCFVCCRPIQFTITADPESGEVLGVEADRS
jgi:hypothetical protein